MNITTMLNALVRASQMRGSIYPKRQRQYHAFRDGILRRWWRMEIAKRAAEIDAETWKEWANGKESHD